MSQLFQNVQTAAGAPFTNINFFTGVFSPQSALYGAAPGALPPVPGGIGRIEDIYISADAAHDMQIWWNPLFNVLALPPAPPVVAGLGWVLIYAYAGRTDALPFHQVDDSGRTLQKPFYMGSTSSGTNPRAIGGRGVLQYIMPGAFAGTLRAITTYSYTPPGGDAL